MVRATLLLMVGFSLAATPSIPELQCPRSRFSVISDPADALKICEMASGAVAQLATCSVLIDRPVVIEVVDRLPEGYIGQYHHGKYRIDLLSPRAAQVYLETKNPMTVRHRDAFYQSIIVHELTHAALDDMPCPISGCYATQEYVAYAMQMRSLSPEARATFLTRPEFNRPISANEINEPIALFAPDVFMQKAWLHFSQQEDPCGFIGQIASGKIFFDRGLP